MSSKGNDEVLETYEVESIVDYRKQKVYFLYEGSDYYLIKWKGYASKHNTWEGLENLNCDQMIRQYWEDIKDQKENNDKEPKLSSVSPRKKDAKQSVPPNLDISDIYVPEKRLPKSKLDIENWDPYIKEIITVTKVSKTNIVCVVWKDGTSSQHTTKKANKKFPQKVGCFERRCLNFMRKISNFNEENSFIVLIFPIF
jgi:hypothetical protein